MSLDNYKIIKPLLEFKEGEFYYIQILKRKKDNPEMDSGEKVIRYYTIESFSDFEKTRPSIIYYCESHRARAYIHPSPRSWKKVSLEMLKDLAIRVSQEDYFCKELFASACGKTHTKKLWVVDLDITSESESDFRKYVDSIRGVIQECPPIPENILEVPTRYGVHLISSPFDLKKFRDILKQTNLAEPDIHKNNPTVLYIPRSILGD